MNREAFFNDARHIFGGRLKQSQMQGLDILLTASEGLPVSHQAYLLATAKHETAQTMQPVREALAKTDDGAVMALEKAWKAGRLPWVRTPYWRKDASGKAWFGRGFVQLTHKENYQTASAKTGIDLIADPSAALSPMIAARILVQGSSEGWFTGRKLSDYLPGDYAGARRVINGTDKANEIAAIAAAFERALLAGGEPAPTPIIPDAPPAPAPQSSGLAWLIKAILNLLLRRTK